MEDFDTTKYKLADEITPFNEKLTAHYKKSYAFFTMTKRVPVILTNIIDQLTQGKEQIVEKYGEASRDELKNCVAEISKLKYELQTDKPMHQFATDDSKDYDQKQWNSLLSEIEPNNNSYFSSVWLYSECYIYRRLKSIFQQSEVLKDFDYFEQSKKLEFKNSLGTITSVIQCVNDFNANPTPDIGEFFCKLLKVNLWGNRNDLSITLGKEIVQSGGDPIQEIESFNDDLLIDQTTDIWKLLSVEKENKIVDIINDNSGYELLCDFVLADFIIEHKLADKIRFRVKAIPWFISDVLPSDFKYTIEDLKKSDVKVLRDAGTKWDNYVKSGQFVLLEPVDHFWTSPYEFYRMEKLDEPLYKSIGEAYLAIFKGDLNYRKLMGDINWDPTTHFRTALSGFEPTNLCSLRTVKADVICGLPPGKAEELFEKAGPNWMSTGKYGVIQFNEKRFFTDDLNSN
ncbi:unnamed protein product [Diamesa serratosioi]